jgi:hypothetical protein
MSSIPLPALSLRPAVTPEDPLNNVTRLAQLSNLLQAQPQEQELRQQQIALGQGQIQQQQYQLGRQKAINDAYAQAVKPDANGNPQFDVPALTKTLAANGHGEAIPEILEGINKYQKSHTDLQEAQQKVDTSSRDAAGAAGYAIQQSQYDPGVATALLTHQMQTPGLDPQHLSMYQQMLQQIQQDPTKVKPLADQMVALSPKYTELQSQAAANQARVTTAKTGQQRLEAELPGGPLANVDRTEMTDWLAKNQGKTPSDFMAYKASLAPNAQVAAAVKANAGMTSSALDNAAEQYWATGQMQGIPRGVAGLPISNAIRNRAAELHAGQSLPEGTAAYAANKKSLGDLQTNTDQMQAFESTGLRNLDLFLNKAAQIPDLGTKFANTPLRLITGKMIGTDAQAAMEAARVTASKEVAKVLSSAKGSGVLSDSQSKEVDDILAGNLSYSAMKSVVNTLKQDMANRHAAYNQQLQDIQGRLGARGSQAQTPQTTKPLSITLPSGKKISIE